MSGRLRDKPAAKNTAPLEWYPPLSALTLDFTTRLGGRGFRIVVHLYTAPFVDPRSIGLLWVTIQPAERRRTRNRVPARHIVAYISCRYILTRTARETQRAGDPSDRKLCR
jgi:hypothetical protein